MIWRASSRTGEARRHLEAALNIARVTVGPDDPVTIETEGALLCQQLESESDLERREAFDALMTWLRSERSRSTRRVAEFTNAGLEMHRQGEVTRAETLYRELLLSFPHNAILRSNFGFLLQHEYRDLVGARAQYEAGLAFTPSSVPLRANLGSLCLLEHKLEEAARHLNEGLRQLGTTADRQAAKILWLLAALDVVRGGTGQPCAGRLRSMLRRGVEPALLRMKSLRDWAAGLPDAGQENHLVRALDALELEGNDSQLRGDSPCISPPATSP